MTKVIGKSSLHAKSIVSSSRKQLLEKSKVAFVVGGGSFLFLLILVSILLPMLGGTLSWLMPLVGGGVIGKFYYDSTTKALHSKKGKAAIGAKKETEIAKILAKSRYPFLINGYIPTAQRIGDVDHILVGPTVIIVESKTGYGEVSYKDGTMWAGRRPIPKDPISQVKSQAKIVSGILHAPVRAIVCVADMTNNPFKVNEVIVCSKRDLLEVVRAQKGSFTKAQQEKFAKVLTQSQK